MALDHSVSSVPPPQHGVATEINSQYSDLPRSYRSDSSYTGSAVSFTPMAYGPYGRDNTRMVVARPQQHHHDICGAEHTNPYPFHLRDRTSPTNFSEVDQNVSDMLQSLHPDQDSENGSYTDSGRGPSEEGDQNRHSPLEIHDRQGKSK